MWISKKDYTAIIEARAKAETRADWLLTRLNQLEHEAGTLKHHVTGIPQQIPIYQREATAPVDNEAELSFEDLGDENARKHGYTLTE